jgi:SAM-dependent methyltransferase
MNPPEETAARRGAAAEATALPLSEAVERGQAAYTPFFLRHVYDPLVVRFANGLGWRCRSGLLLAHYDAHVSADHLDVGPGTGWYLDRCRFPSSRPRITLLDVNEHVLAESSARLSRYGPDVVRANVLEPLPATERRYDSVALGHVLHCLPGPLPEKMRALDHVRLVLRPGGTLFGSTILSEGVRHTRFSRGYLDYMNESGVFDNKHDSLDDLQGLLAARFDRFTLRVIGVTALFSAQA